MRSFLSMQLLFVAFFLALSGCSIQSTVPPTSKLSLNAHPKIPVIKDSAFKEKVIRMGVIESTTMLSGTTIYYTTDSGENYSYTKARWNESVTKKLGDAMVQSLSKSHIFKDVIPFRSLAKNDLIFEINIYDFSQVIHDDGTSTVHMAVKLRVVEQYNRNIIATKLFEKSINDLEGNVQGAMKGYNKLLNDCLTETLKWLQKNA